MSLKKINPRLAVLLVFVLLAAVFRLMSAEKVIPAIANFSPIGAMALFGGTYFTTKWKGYLVPLFALFVSDVVMMQTVYKGIGNGILYGGWYWVYGVFAVMVLVGQFITKVNIQNVLLAAVAAAVLHWLVTDFGVWLGGGIDVTNGQPLTKDWHGLMQCYMQGIPFMKNLLLGNIIYGAILYGGFELLQKRFPVLQLRIA